MKITKLKEHSFIKYIQPYLIAYINKCDSESPKNVNPSPSERIAVEMIFELRNITECIDQLYFSVELLAGYRANIGHKLMNRHDYIVYSTENILFRITSIFDRCLRLANRIYDIGIPDRECRESTIIKNSKIKGTETMKSLIELNKFTHAFRKLRNEIAHANCFNDNKLNEMQGFYYLLQSNTPEIEHLKQRFKTKADNYVTTKKKEFTAQIIILEKLVDNFFSAIMPRLTMVIGNTNDR